MIRKDCRCITLDSIKVSARPGAEIYSCMVEAMQISLVEDCKVILIHNGREFLADSEGLLKTVKQISGPNLDEK